MAALLIALAAPAAYSNSREALEWSRTRDGVQVVEDVVPRDSLERDITTLFGALRGKTTPSS